MEFRLFCSTVVNSLAWPATVLIVIRWFREPLSVALWRLAGRKWGPVDTL